MRRFHASRYNIFVPLLGRRRLAYNSLSGAFAIWDAADGVRFDEICAGAGEPASDARDFQKAGFVIAEGVDELALLEQQYVQHRFDGSSLVLTLAPTMACNFGCDYCFQGQDKAAESMSDAVQDGVLALIQRAAPDIRRVHVAWYGGEPLMRRKLIEQLSDRILAFCGGRGLAYDASVVTNGFMLNPEAVAALEARRVATVQVTLDGTPQFHDHRRHLLNGKPTFNRIVNNLRESVEKTAIQFSIRVNIDARNSEEIHELIECLAAEGLNNRKNFRLYFAPVEAITEGCHAVADSCMPKVDYAALEARLYRLAFDRGLCQLPYPPRFRGVCAAVRPKGFVVLPTGDVHKCWDTVANPASRIGSVLNLDSLGADARTAAWLDWTPFANETCRNCRILPNCAGACAYKFVHAEDTRGEAAILPCPSWKYNLHEQLVFRAERMGKITAADYDPEATRTVPADLCATLRVEGRPLPPPAERLVQLQLRA